MFITRATRHDRADIMELLEAHGWSDTDLTEGVAFIARDGKVAGIVRLVEVAPQTVVVDDVLVREDVRRTGIGRRLMQAALNSRGGKLWLCCHEEVIPFYEHLGFRRVEVENLPSEALEYFEKAGDYPTPPDHVHYFMTAR